MPSSPSSAPLSLEVIAPVGRLACSAVTCSLPFDPPNGRLTALQAVDCTFISTQLGPNANTLIIFGDCGISCIEKCRGRVLGVSPRQGGPLAVDWACTTRRIQHLWLFPTLLTNVYLRDEWYFLDTVHVHKRAIFLNSVFSDGCLNPWVCGGRWVARVGTHHGSNPQQTGGWGRGACFRSCRFNLNDLSIQYEAQYEQVIRGGIHVG